MIMFPYAAKHFLDEVNKTMSDFNPSLRETIMKSDEYIHISELYRNSKNKSDFIIVLEETVDEYNTGKKNQKRADWEKTYRHCEELYSSYPFKEAKELIEMMYTALYSREELVNNMAKSYNISTEEANNILTKKGM